MVRRAEGRVLFQKGILAIPGPLAGGVRVREPGSEKGKWGKSKGECGHPRFCPEPWWQSPAIRYVRELGL